MSTSQDSLHVNQPRQSPCQPAKTVSSSTSQDSLQLNQPRQSHRDEHRTFTTPHHQEGVGNDNNPEWSTSRQYIKQVERYDSEQTGQSERLKSLWKVKPKTTKYISSSHQTSFSSTKRKGILINLVAPHTVTVRTSHDVCWTAQLFQSSSSHTVLCRERLPCSFT